MALDWRTHPRTVAQSAGRNRSHLIERARNVEHDVPGTTRWSTLFTSFRLQQASGELCLGCDWLGLDAGRWKVVTRTFVAVDCRHRLPIWPMGPVVYSNVYWAHLWCMDRVGHGANPLQSRFSGTLLRSGWDRHATWMQHEHLLGGTIGLGGLCFPFGPQTNHSNQRSARGWHSWLCLNSGVAPISIGQSDMLQPNTSPWMVDLNRTFSSTPFPQN